MDVRCSMTKRSSKRGMRHVHLLRQVVGTHNASRVPMVPNSSRKRLITFLVLSAAACSWRQDKDQLFREHDDRGDRYMERQQPLEAIIEYRIAAQLRPQSGAVRKKLAQTYLGVGDKSHALAEFSRAADLLPDDIDVQLT